MRFNFVILFIGVWINSFSQNWATGAAWYYTYETFGGGSGSTKFNASMDTIILGKNCTKITQQVSFSNGRPSVEYLYLNSDTVFFYDTSFAEFQVLYDFNADAGDYWFIRFKDFYPLPGDIDSIKITVNTTDFITVNSLALKRLFVTYDYFIESGGVSYDGVIVESLGDLTCMFNFSSYDNLIVDGIYSTGLRCYDDGILGHYEAPGINGHCEFLSSLVHEQSTKFKVSPNPVIDNLTIDSSAEFYYLYSSVGKVISSGELNSTPINLACLESGIYFLVLTFPDQTQETLKFLKE